MSNQILLWSTLVVPWLTLFFMKKEEIKRWMPVALYVMVTNFIIADVGFTLQMWEVGENIFPLHDILPTALGVLPIATMWLLKFTYGRFWLYALIELILSVVFAYIVQPWYSSRGIWVFINATPLKAFFPAIPHFISVYLYQMWQEGIFTHYDEKKFFSSSLQPATAKPLPKEQNKPDSE